MVDYYQLQRQWNEGSWSWVVNQTSQPWSYTDPNLVDGDYRYRIRACNSTGSYTNCAWWRYSLTGTAAPHPSFSVNDTVALEGNQLTFTVSKLGLTSQNYQVDYTTNNGSAVATSDFISQSGSLTFTSSESSKTVTIVSVDNNAIESTETFTLVLSNPSGGGNVIGFIGNRNDQR